jgi:maleylacetoacetate isomerase
MMQLYGFWRSNAAFRVRVALALKAIPFEETEVDLLSGSQFDPAYVMINPEYVVPTLVHDGHRISQSLAIIEYLDEVQANPSLLPRDARERAYARSLAMIQAADSHPLTVPGVREHLREAFGADPDTIEACCRHWTGKGLATYERLLERRPASPFALGATISIADIGIAGQVALADVYQMDWSEFPEVAHLARRCFDVPAFADAHPFAQPGYRTRPAPLSV